MNSPTKLGPSSPITTIPAPEATEDPNKYTGIRVGPYEVYFDNGGQGANRTVKCGKAEVTIEGKEGEYRRVGVGDITLTNSNGSVHVQSKNGPIYKLDFNRMADGKPTAQLVDVGDLPKPPSAKKEMPIVQGLHVAEEGGIKSSRPDMQTMGTVQVGELDLSFTRGAKVAERAVRCGNFAFTISASNPKTLKALNDGVHFFQQGNQLHIQRGDGPIYLVDFAQMLAGMPRVSKSPLAELPESDAEYFAREDGKDPHEGDRSPASPNGGQAVTNAGISGTDKQSADEAYFNSEDRRGPHDADRSPAGPGGGPAVASTGISGTDKQSADEAYFKLEDGRGHD